MKKLVKRKKPQGAPRGVKSSVSREVFFRDFIQIVLVGLSVYLIVVFFTPWGGEAGQAFLSAMRGWLGTTAYFAPLLPMMILVFLHDPLRKPTWLHLGYLATWLLSIWLFFDILGAGGNSEKAAAPFIQLFGNGGSLVLAWTFLALATLLVLNISLVKVASAFFAKSIALASRGALFAAAGIRKVREWVQPAWALLAGLINRHQAAVEPVEEHAESSILVGEMEPDEEIPPPQMEELPLPEPETIPPPPEIPAAKPVLKKKKQEESDSNGYKLPSLDMLEEAEPRKEKGARIEPENYSKLLEETLLSFGIEATVIHVERGPSVTRYELQPAKGVKVSKIVALSDDLALALAATSLRIEAPIPGKSAIGIEIPNSSVAMVYFRDLLSHPLYQESPLRTILALGKDITGKPIFTELRRMPHLLIAGATGSGKTVCINTLIASILFKASPHEVQFVMIDPKRVELTIYDGIPHLIQEVVTDPKQAAKVLVDVLAIMDERYNLFKEARVRNLEEYNKACADRPLPYIVVLIDELADLMMLAAAAVESSIARLTALARAAGIHLIVATQRPSVDVITGIIKANIPSRIAFAVSSIADSRTILDTGGSEKLLGRGDMLFAPIDAMKPVRLQGAYVGLGEIEALVSFWSKQPSPQNLVQLPQITEEESSQEPEESGDDLYPQAREIILRTGQASVSTLQRKLKIGYARAGRLMDLMEKRGVVGPADGAKPRKILVPNPFRVGN